MKNLIEFLKANDIKVVRFIVIGNSIASGFSLSCKMKPLMFYNEYFVKNLEKNGFKVEVNHFARPQDNSNKRILEWLYQDIKVVSMQRESLTDNMQMCKQFKREKYKYNYEDKTKFYYNASNQYKKINELIENEEGVYNICILSCCTGAFLDSLTRNNLFPWKTLTCFNSFFKDLMYFEQILDYLFVRNSYMPVFVNPIHLVKPIIPIILYGNYLIRKRAKKHWNAYMINPIYTKGFYSTPEYKGPFFDYHPCEYEYEKLCGNINNKIDETIFINHVKQYFYDIFRDFAVTANQYGYLDEKIEQEDIKMVYEEVVRYLKKLNYSESLINQGYNEFYKIYVKEYESNFYRIKLKNFILSL